MTRVTAEQIARARGCILGLVLGDAIGATTGNVPASGPLQAKTASQLACFTIEGSIRANIRSTHKGICHPPSIIWHAYTRWAALQGVPGIKRYGDEAEWPDGWLSQVSLLAARRGSAPATVAALQGREMGTPDRPVGKSLGAHALTRVLPAGLIEWGVPDAPVRFAVEVAVTTHAPEAAAVAGFGAAIVANCREGRRIQDSIEQAQREYAAHTPITSTGTPDLTAALTVAQSRPCDPAELARLAPDARASSALTGAVYVAACFPGADMVGESLKFAASVPHGDHIAPVVGSFLGATHGCSALPVDLVSRLELAWVADVLARDFLTEFVDHPSGGEYTPATDPHWWNRYPGW